MSKKSSYVSALALTLGAPLVFANAVTTCTHDSSIREIRVVYEVPGQPVPCSVSYIKDGTEQTLWRAESTEGYCEQKAEEFVEKQVSWGWTCDSQATAGEATGSSTGTEAAMPSENADEPIAEEEEVDAPDPIDESTEG